MCVCECVYVTVFKKRLFNICGMAYTEYQAISKDDTVQVLARFEVHP